MPKQLLHITFRFSDLDPKITELKPVFDRATDWFRYAPNCWIVWTGRSAERWYELLKPHITDDDSMFIVRIDPSESQGWLSKAVWDWLQQHKPEK
jgi:hypothetical protein